MEKAPLGVERDARGLAFARGWCLQSLSPKEGLLGATLPGFFYLPFLPPTLPLVSARPRRCGVGVCAALSQHSPYVER